MKTLNSLQRINSHNQYLSLAIGNFDGVHVGHQQLLRKAFEDALNNKGISAVMTFWPHPLKILKKNIPLKLLTTIERKKELISGMGIEYAFILPFSDQFMELTPEEFVEKILVKELNVSSVHVGYNFSFGKDALGKSDDLIKLGEKHNIKVNILPEIKVQGQSVSSTLIRHCIEDGEIELANLYLGHNYTMEGLVVSGEQRGRNLGFPTANLETDNELIVPASGVYAVYVYLHGQQFRGVLNIGYKPTFGDNNPVTIEAHILDFSSDLYGEKLKVEFIKRIRGEKKFSSAEHLIQEITNDIKLAKQCL